MDAAERETWREADRHFTALAELDGEARRDALAKLRLPAPVQAKLDLMLASLERHHATLDDGLRAMPPSVAPDEPGDPLDGHRVDDWRLANLLGHGGMASVYRAERIGHDFRQQGALKLLARTLHGAGEHARFRRERQILAQLQHPHIAGLIDGGVAADGTPYLVMQLVEGERIDAYCERLQLDARSRVHLLLDVCGAIAYAHRQLVIHRDIKPGNILVDGDGRAMLLDFGIARLLDDSAREATVTLAFTPDYAAPEQRAGRSDLGTAVDVYGLGAVLHRLLAGTPPRNDGRGDALPASRSVRSNGHDIQARQLAGDLDAILARALASDITQRYASVDAFAADLQRWLQHRPVEARQRSLWQRTGKLVRRNPLASALAALCLVVAGLGAVAAYRAHFRLERRAAELQALARFQSDMLEHIDPQQVAAGLRKDFSGVLQQQADLVESQRDALLAKTDFTGLATGMLDRALLSRARESVQQRFEAQPVVQATLLQSLARIYRRLMKFDAARPLQDEAAALRLRTLGPGNRATLASMREQARLAIDLNAADAHELAEQALAAHRRYLGDDDADTALARAVLGDEMLMHDAAGAETQLRAALAHIETVQGAIPPEVVQIRGDLATALAEQGRYAEAEPAYTDAIHTATAVLGANHADTLQLRNLLAWVHGRLGNAERAHAEYQALYPLYLRSFGEFDPRTLNLLNNIAAWPRRNGDYAAAEAPQRKAYQGMLLALGPSHQTTVRMQINLAEIELGLGKLDQAQQLLATALAQPRQGDSRYDLPRIQSLLGDTARKRGDDDAAERWWQRAWESAADPPQPESQRDLAAKLVTLYDERADNEQARLWQARAQPLAQAQ
jgi:serine/threonine-protein kinase